MKTKRRDKLKPIPIKELKNGYLYNIDARNSSYGIWNGESGRFYLLRHKFNFTFIDEEIHYDLDDRYGTAIPLKEIEKSPFMPTKPDYYGVAGCFSVETFHRMKEYLEKQGG